MFIELRALEIPQKPQNSLIPNATLTCYVCLGMYLCNILFADLIYARLASTAFFFLFYRNRSIFTLTQLRRDILIEK